ncbi:XRE family transcriptional regulator [bacterium D16-51]|nr:XRE family transcriptional regulator [bacterium D16-59]RKI61322.1 XRE family transcriptional regulator [bacterium D16-51]
MAERVNQHKNPIIGKNIRRLRKEHGMKSIDVITKLQLKGMNINIGTFSKIENGYNNPSVDLLIALTDILDCDFNAFFDTEKNHRIDL